MRGDDRDAGRWGSDEALNPQRGSAPDRACGCCPLRGDIQKRSRVRQVLGGDKEPRRGADGDSSPDRSGDRVIAGCLHEFRPGPCSRLTFDEALEARDGGRASVDLRGSVHLAERSELRHRARPADASLWTTRDEGHSGPPSLLLRGDAPRSRLPSAAKRPAGGGGGIGGGIGAAGRREARWPERRMRPRWPDRIGT